MLNKYYHLTYIFYPFMQQWYTWYWANITYFIIDVDNNSMETQYANFMSQNWVVEVISDSYGIPYVMTHILQVLFKIYFGRIVVILLTPPAFSEK